MSRPADKIARSIRAICISSGYWCRHISADLNPGIPDLLICGKSYAWVEVKSKHDIIRPSQNAWASLYQSEGGQNCFRIKEMPYGFLVENFAHGVKHIHAPVPTIASAMYEIFKVINENVSN